jgi:co-chaperonin GroES (HSP10)
VDVGRDVEDEDLYVGARILYSLYAGTDLEVEGERRVLLNADQALAIVGADEVVEAV